MKKYLDYIFIVFIWVLIFGKLVFSKLFLLDYTPYLFFNTVKILELTNFKNIWYPYEALKLILLQFNILHLLFQIAILISILVSYYYIMKLVQKNSLIFAILFIFNPFTYSRIMVGQLGVIVSYFLIPMYLFYLFKLFKNNFEKKDIAKTVIAYSIASSASPQFFVFNFVFFILASMWFYSYNSRFNAKKYIKASSVFLILLILINLYWLQGIFLSSDHIFESIDDADKQMFSPKLTQDVSAVAKIMGMWGFWRESAYITTYNAFPLWLWYLLTFIFIITMIIGYSANPVRKAKFFFSLWWIGLVFATGISHPYTAPFFDFFFKYIPFFSGFRDSHKFVALIALSYAYLCPLGILWIRKKLRNITKNLNLKVIVYYGIPALLIGLIILYTYPLISLWGQIKPAEYPKSYQQTDDFLGRQELTGYVIYLPWEAFITYNWTKQASPDGRIAVPINKLVKPAVVTSSGRWGYETRLKYEINSCLKNMSTGCLETIGVQYILVDKCPTFSLNFSWINNTKIHEDACIDIYELNNTKKIDKVDVPLRFVIGSLISLILLILIIGYLIIC